MSLKISRILHAGYVIECDQTAIAFDPIFENPFSNNSYAYPNVEFNIAMIRKLNFDAVFLSHYHDDHCSLKSLNLLARDTPIYLYCQIEEVFMFIKELGFTHVRSLQIDTPVQIGTIEVIPRRALDSDVDSMLHVRAQGLHILNVVDAWIDDQTIKQLSKFSWDMILWPFQTMLETDVLSPSRAERPSTELPPEWIEQLTTLNAKYVVPSSCQFIQEPWSWYANAYFPISYQQFEKEIKPISTVVRLNPGVSVNLSKDDLQPSAALTWLQPVGEQDVDYIYNPSPMSTAEVAQNFQALLPEQIKTVINYCEHDIFKKYEILGRFYADYFQTPRVWKLSIYDHSGKVLEFYYQVHADKILTNLPVSEVEWHTEIPMIKLYGALQLGEQLNSIYIRINDCRFAANIERQISDADLLEDPLLRCLYGSDAVGYQRTQLRRLLADEDSV